MEENQEVFLSMKNEIEKQSQREVDAIMAGSKEDGRRSLFFYAC